MIALLILFVVSLIINGICVFIIKRCAERLLAFDDMYEMLTHDIDTNISYFEKLVNTPLLSNLPEILEAQRNMRIIRDRLNEYILRMEDLTRRQLKKHSDKPRPPIVA